MYIERCPHCSHDGLAYIVEAGNVYAKCTLCMTQTIMYDSVEIIGILRDKIDHTILNPAAKANDVYREGVHALLYGAASLCIPPCHIQTVKSLFVGFEEVGRRYRESGAICGLMEDDRRTKICTVVGFPCGYNTTNQKVNETKECIGAGAEEIDMVINISHVKDRQSKFILDEVNAIKEVCGDRILKVIIETCMLTEEDKIYVLELLAQSNCDYVKTSTGFSTGGATLYDIDLMKKHCAGKNIKASGGVKDIVQAIQMVKHGADRIGSSSLLLTIIKERNK